MTAAESTQLLAIYRMAWQLQPRRPRRPARPSSGPAPKPEPAPAAGPRPVLPPINFDKPPFPDSPRLSGP